MAAKLIAATQTFKPQSLMYFGGDTTSSATPPPPVLVTVFTGSFFAGHGAGHSKTSLDILFPLVDGTQSLLTYPIASLFASAVATAALSATLGKGSQDICEVNSAVVDLRMVDLAPSQPAKKVLVPVLSARLESQNSEVNRIAYHVTVISRGLPTRLVPVAIDNAVWDGTYSKIGSVVVAGDPSP